MKLGSQCARDLPIAGFLGQNKLIEGLQRARSPEKHSPAHLIDRDFVEHLAHRDFKNRVHERTHSHEEEVEIFMLNLGREWFTEAGANQRCEYQVARLSLSGAEGCQHGNPAANVAFTQNGESVAHGVILGPKPKTAEFK